MYITVQGEPDKSRQASDQHVDLPSINNELVLLVVLIFSKCYSRVPNTGGGVLFFDGEIDNPPCIVNIPLY